MFIFFDQIQVKKCWLGTIYVFLVLVLDYKRFFESKDVLYVLNCNNCDFFYIGQTEGNNEQENTNQM